ncbi:MAG: hypothetical protein U0903_09120 [Planctomycetales bacterium]
MLMFAGVLFAVISLRAVTFVVFAARTVVSVMSTAMTGVVSTRSAVVTLVTERAAAVVSRMAVHHGATMSKVVAVSEMVAVRAKAVVLRSTEVAVETTALGESSGEVAVEGHATMGADAMTSATVTSGKVAGAATVGTVSEVSRTGAPLGEPLRAMLTVLMPLEGFADRAVIVVIATMVHRGATIWTTAMFGMVTVFKAATVATSHAGMVIIIVVMTGEVAMSCFFIPVPGEVPSTRSVILVAPIFATAGISIGVVVIAVIPVGIPRGSLGVKVIPVPAITIFITVAGRTVIVIPGCVVSFFVTETISVPNVLAIEVFAVVVT